MSILYLWMVVLLFIGCSERTDNTSGAPDLSLELEMSVQMDMNTADTDIGADAIIADAGVVGIRPDEMPLDGEATLSGADDLTQAVAQDAVRAGVVTDESEKLTGPEANCRIGDFRLDNAVVSICIQAETTFSQFSFFGGNIIDAHLANRPGTDAFREIFIAPGVGEAVVERIGIVRDGSDGEVAAIRTEGRAQGLLILQGVLPNGFTPPASHITTEYRLKPNSNVVEVLTWVRILETFAVNLRLVDFVYFGDRTAKFIPETALEAPASQLPYIAATAKDVSYRWDADYAPFDLFITTFIDDIPGTPVVSSNPLLNPDDMILFRRQLTIGNGDIESLRDSDENGRTIEFSGRPKSHILILDEADKAVTTVRLNEGGSGLATIADGNYVIRNWDDLDDPLSQAFSVEGEDVLVEIEMAAPAKLTIELRGPDGEPTDGQVRLRGPRNKTLFILGSDTIELPEGEWTATISRGWHYGIFEDEFTLTAGEETQRSFQFVEEIPLNGFASGEFHQHASPSVDSEVPVEERVKSNLAAGVQFMVPSDHDIIYPYQQLIDRMGVGDRISAPLPGEEISPLFAHIGAYGLPYDPYAGAGGALRLPVMKEDGRWRVYEIPELVQQARERGAEIIQVNHGRDDHAYFDHVDYNPETPIQMLDPEKFTADFDSMEVFNATSYFCKNFSDWQGLLNQGLRVTAIGNSDTHSVNQPPGYPRNYIRTLAPNPARVSAAEITDSVRTGSLTVGGGAMIDFPNGPQPGDTIAPQNGVVTLSVRVRTPSYTKVDRLIVYVNGQRALDRPINATVESLVDFEADVTVPISQDAHVSVIAIGEARMPAIRPGAPVFALSNPVFVDVDGDGLSFPGPGPIEDLGFDFCTE